jgi:tetrahydromethanopterin S-methyltransferase subunit B
MASEKGSFFGGMIGVVISGLIALGVGIYVLFTMLGGLPRTSDSVNTSLQTIETQVPVLLGLIIVAFIAMVAGVVIQIFNR